MLYRTAGLEDIPGLIRMRIEFLKEVSPGTKVNEQAFSQELYQYFSKHIAAGDFINWLAVENDTMIGTGGICIHEYPPTFKAPTIPRAYIMNVYTITSHRNRGIARVLFKHLIDEAKSKKVAMVSLHATEAGKSIYRDFGFVERNDEMVLFV